MHKSIQNHLSVQFTVSRKLVDEDSELIGTVSQTKRRGSLSSQKWETGQRPLSSVSWNCCLEYKEDMYSVR